MLALDPTLTAADVRAAALEMSEAEAQALLYDWRMWARPEQVMPEGNWRTWLIKAGRGFGKTRSGAEAVREIVTADPNARVALVAPTAADARDVMIEGESGLLNVFPPGERPEYFPSKRRLQFTNGALGFVYSAERADRLRGPQHSGAWLDEIAVYDDIDALWSNLVFGLRLGADPRIIATTTPRPMKFLRDLIADRGTVVTSGSTFANRANLPASSLAEFERIYGGTRIGRQELEGELLEEAEGALWSRARIEELRVKSAPELVRIVIPIDPSTTSGPESDECGIVPVGLGVDGHGYVLADRSGRMSPDDWISRAVATYDQLDGDRIICEANNGGDLIESLLRTQRRNISYERVHAARGKLTRAEPVAALFEQGKVHMVGAFPALEDELTNYVAGMSQSPNRLDSMVWGLSYLMLKPKLTGKVFSL
ncbi:MAG TPA: terminase family protein [Pseudolabrys sp.]|nr:terminase family protein [Pseudolabrys sp.]